MGVFYTNHCIVRKHSCPPHERAHTGLPWACWQLSACSLELPGAQGSSPGSELAASQGTQLSCAGAAPAVSLKARGWTASPGISNTGIYTHASVWHFTCGTFYWCVSCSTFSRWVCRANLQLSTCTIPWLAQLSRGSAWSFSSSAVCPVMLSQYMQNSWSVPGEKTHNKPLLKLV